MPAREDDLESGYRRLLSLARTQGHDAVAARLLELAGWVP